MPLAKLGRLFPDLALARPETVVDRPGLLFVQRVQGWTIDRPEETWETFLIYKSPLVKGTSRLYRPVADLLLPAERQELLFEAEHDDEHMMHGKGICSMVRINYPVHATTKFPVEMVKEIIHDHVFESIRTRLVKESV